MEERIAQLTRLTPALLEWFRDHRRELPWRSDPTPYHVWVSEIMLQQTRVAAVLGYYRRFMEALPTVEALAAVEEDRLLKLWQGLGYYNRARNLQKAARQIVLFEDQDILHAACLQLQRARHAGKSPADDHDLVVVFKWFHRISFKKGDGFPSPCKFRKAGGRQGSLSPFACYCAYCTIHL